MRLGLQLPSFSYPGGTGALRGRLTEIAQAAEAAGLSSLWHLIVNMPEVWDLRHLEHIGREVVPALSMEAAPLSA